MDMDALPDMLRVDEAAAVLRISRVGPTTKSLRFSAPAAPRVCPRFASADGCAFRSAR